MAATDAGRIRRQTNMFQWAKSGLSIPKKKEEQETANLRPKIVAVPVSARKSRFSIRRRERRLAVSGGGPDRLGRQGGRVRGRRKMRGRKGVFMRRVVDLLLEGRRSRNPLPSPVRHRGRIR